MLKYEKKLLGRRFGFMRSFLDKKSIRSSWIVSYSLIIALFLAALLSVIFVSRSTIKREINQTNSNVMSLLTSEFNQIKQDMDSLSLQLQTNSVVSPFLEPVEWNADTFLALKESSSEIENMLIPYSCAEKVCIYNPTTDIILLGGGIIRAHTYYQNYIFDENAHTDYNSWKKAMMEHHFHEFYRSPNGEVFHITSAAGNSGETANVIIITVNPYALERLTDSRSSNFEDIVVVNHLNQPIFSKNGTLFKNLLESGTIDFEKSDKTYRADRGEVIVYTSQPQSKIRCVFAVAENTVYRGLNILITVITVCLVPLILLILWLMLFYSKKHYKPIGNLLAMLNEYQDSHNGQSNEFAIIEASLNTLIAQEKNGQRIKESYRKKLFSEDFSAYLRSDFYHRNLPDLLSLYDIDFSYENYLTAIISISSINEEIWTTDSYDAENSNDRLIPLAITNIYSEILGNDFRLLAISTSPDTIFCLIGTNIKSPEALRHLAGTRTDYANRTISEQVGIESFVYISDCFNDLEKTRTVYKQLNHICMFEQRSDMDGKRVLFFDDFKENTDSYRLEIEFEERLTNAIGTGNADSAKEALAELLEDYPNVLSPSQFIVIKHTLLNKLINISHLTESDVSAQKLQSLIEQIDHITTVKQLRSVMFDMIDIISSVQQPQDIADQVKDYVDKNFADTNLNINMLGETFFLTPSYLSNLFKLKKGEMLKEYIKKVRLTHAKELLKTDMRVEEIAKNCGFVDSKLFIRTFKLYYNVTPGQYRKELYKH